MNKITLVLGTAREKNFSHKVAEIVKAKLEEKDLEINFVNVSNYLFGKTIGSDNEMVKSWADSIQNSEAVIFVSPEYNHSYPGELKILIDSLYDEYKGKVAGLVTVSAGQYGGVRVAEKLNDLLHTVNFVVARSAVNVSGVQKGIDEDKMEKHLDTLISEMKDLVSN